MPPTKRFDVQNSIGMSKDTRCQLDALAAIDGKTLSDIARDMWKEMIPVFVDRLSPEQREQYDNLLNLYQQRYTMKAEISEN